MRPLPLGIQTFRKVIEGGYVYADKTRYIWELTQAGQVFFLSRPRRFGKSLFVDTLKEAFQGHRDLFDGLALADTDFDFTGHPVIHLDLSDLNVGTAAELRRSLMDMLEEVALEEGVDVTGDLPAVRLRRLIKALHAKTGRRVVVLVDEYDKPIVEHASEPQLAEANRVELRSVYGVLKKADPYLRFVFLTGVAKFSRTSIFSQLNSLTDITLEPAFAGICGITEQEFDALFSEHLAAASLQIATGSGQPDNRAATRQQLFEWYDGFSWDGTTSLFNPFSLLSFFHKRDFQPFWYSSGTPQFLIDVWRRTPADYAEVQGSVIAEDDIDSRDIEDAPLNSLLFQTGFLTVKQVRPGGLGRSRTYVLGFPNREVTQAMAKNYLEALSADFRPGAPTLYQRLASAFAQGRPEELESILTGLFATIPWNLHQGRESFYHGIFLAVVQLFGFRVVGESAVADGEMDVDVTQPPNAYIIEFKYAKTATDATPEAEAAALDRAADEALAQIDERRYAAKFAGTGLSVFKVAVAVAGRGHVRVRLR
jgi:hypothetical protein